jgi:hypothetical protein
MENCEKAAFTTQFATLIGGGIVCYNGTSINWIILNEITAFQVALGPKRNPLTQY